MNYYEGSDIVIRNMTYSDIPLIVVSENTQGVRVDPEKFYFRLEDQEKCKNIALVAEYNGSIVGYVYVYPFSLNGPFKDKGYSEIVDFKVLENYKNLGFGMKLMDAAEKVASDYSGTAYLSVDVSNWEYLDFYIKRGFVPHQSGVWRKKEIDYKSNGEIEDKFGLWLSKKVEFPLINTTKYPFFEWFNTGIRTVDVRVNYGKYKKVQVNDKIIFADTTNPNNFIVGKVIFKHEYRTTGEMLQFEGVKNVLPFFNDDDLEEGILFFEKLPDWWLVKQYGCIAFGIKIVD